MTAAVAPMSAVDFDPAWMDTITTAPTPTTADMGTIPASQWNGTVAALSAVCAAASSPSTYLTVENGEPMFKWYVDSASNRVVIGHGLDAGLDGVRSDAVDLNDPTGTANLYREAAAFRLVIMGRTRAGLPDAAPAPTGTGWLGVAVAVGVIVTVAGIAASAWYRATVATATIQAKTSELAINTAVAQGGRDGVARLAEFARTGRMPPPTPLELSVADVVRAQAAAHRENAPTGYIADALRSLQGAGATVAQGASDGLKWAAVVAAVLLFFPRGK